MPIYEPEAGPRWAERATLPGLASVIDPADRLGAKNALIDRVQRRALARALGDVRGRRIVDFGCGTGRISAQLARAGADVLGIDASPEMIAVAERGSGASYAVVDDGRLPCGDDSVDAVISVTVLQYMPHVELTPLLAEWSRVIRPGGIAVAIEQVSDGELGRGASASTYTSSFERAGLAVRDEGPIRLGSSRWTRLVERQPRFGHLPFLAALVEREARRAAPDRYVGAEYAEYCIVAMKPRQSTTVR